MRAAAVLKNQQKATSESAGPPDSKAHLREVGDNLTLVTSSQKPENGLRLNDSSFPSRWLRGHAY